MDVVVNIIISEKEIKEMINDEYRMKGNTRARVQRNSDFVKKRRGTMPISERDLHRYLPLLKQAEFVCVGCSNYTIQLADVEVV